MIVWVDDAVFAPGEARDVDRLALLRNAERRRHTLLVSESPDDMWGERKAPNFEAWLKGLQSTLRSEVRLLLERLDLVSVNAVTRGANRILVTDGPAPSASGCHVGLFEAIRTVGLPLHLLVENVLNDAAFLRRVMPPAWRDRFDKWERSGELVFENGGGNTVMTAIVRHFTDDNFARDATGLPADVWRLMHFLVYDHDGPRSESPEPNAKELKRACRTHEMESRSHMLERRDQEHYLPREALQKVLEYRYKDADEPTKIALQAALKVVLALPLDERSFVDLPKAGGSPFCKNAFFKEREAFDWSDAWFHGDGAWPEMTRLAETIAAAI